MRFLIHPINRHRLELMVLLTLFFVMQACNVADEEFAEEPMQTVYLSVTRSQGSHASFNKDQEDFEDRVHDLAMLVFDTESGDLVCKYFEEGIPVENENKTFQVEMKPGKRDFFFLGNVPMNELQAISHKGDVEKYINRLVTLPEELFTTATREKGFPMSAIYLNQTIEGGGTEEAPRPFLPDNQDRIYLERVVAKVDLSLLGVPADFIKEVALVNGVNEYSMKALPTEEGKTKGKSRNLRVVQGTQYSIYFPEAIFKTAEVWNKENSQQIHYLQVTFKNGRKHLIPLVSNGDASKENYLSFARGKEEDNEVQPDYNIYRNHHYQLVAQVKATAKEMEITMQVLPWRKVDSELDFALPKYHIDVQAEALEGVVNLPQQTKAKVRFKLESPAGALWHSSVTNSLFFAVEDVPESDLASDEVSGTFGIATASKYYAFYVVPTQEYNYTTQYTELYITVDGKEIPLLNQSDWEEIGRKNRYVFKQVE